MRNGRGFICIVASRTAAPGRAERGSCANGPVASLRIHAASPRRRAWQGGARPSGRRASSRTSPSAPQMRTRAQRPARGAVLADGLAGPDRRSHHYERASGVHCWRGDTLGSGWPGPAKSRRASAASSDRGRGQRPGEEAMPVAASRVSADRSGQLSYLHIVRLDTSNL